MMRRPIASFLAACLFVSQAWGATVVLNPYQYATAGGNQSLFDIITDLGLTTNLELALDAGDADSVGGADTATADTVLLLHMDGSDGSTTFTDSSASPLTVTPVGDAQIDTAQFVFGGASGLFDGTGDRLSVADDVGFDLGQAAEPFTIKARVRQVSGANAGFFGRGGGVGDWNTTDGNMYLLFIDSGTLYFQFNQSGSPDQVTTTAPSSGAWHEIAVTYDGTNVRLFVDGAVAATSGTVTSITAPTTRNITYVGDLPSGSYALNGWVDELHVINGTALYTAAYTPPATKWQDTSGNGYDFLRGDGTTETTFPTFNGTPGGLSSSEYFSFDGGDYLTYDTTNETWMENLHKDNAAWTVLVWLYPAGAGNNRLFGNSENSSTNVGLIALINTSTGEATCNISNSTGSYAKQIVPTGFGAVDSAWQSFALSVDEAGNTAFWARNGVRPQTLSASYTSPSAAGATFTFQIGTQGNDGVPLPSGARMAMFAMWSRALTLAEISNINAVTGGRFQ
jgi:hypothetical protein